MLIRIDEKGFVTFSDGHQFGLNSIQTILKGDSSQIKKLFFLNFIKMEDACKTNYKPVFSPVTY